MFCETLSLKRKAKQKVNNGIWKIFLLFILCYLLFFICSFLFLFSLLLISILIFSPFFDLWKEISSEDQATRKFQEGTFREPGSPASLCLPRLLKLRLCWLLVVFAIQKIQKIRSFDPWLGARRLLSADGGRCMQAHAGVMEAQVRACGGIRTRVFGRMQNRRNLLPKQTHTQTQIYK